MFPEIDYSKVEKIRGGMDITIVTTAKSDEEARELLRLLGGCPFGLLNIGGEDRYGQEIVNSKSQTNTKVCCTCLQQMSNMWQTTSLLRKFGMCRLCFRKLANEGKIPGVRKASW